MEEGKDAEAKKEEPISESRKTELKEQLRAVDKKIMTMEWDKDHNQLNAGMEQKYNELKEEHEKIAKKIDGPEEN